MLTVGKFILRIYITNSGRFKEFEAVAMKKERSERKSSYANEPKKVKNKVNYLMLIRKYSVQHLGRRI